jgi:hypothetical protein
VDKDEALRTILGLPNVRAAIIDIDEYKRLRKVYSAASVLAEEIRNGGDDRKEERNDALEKLLDLIPE